MYIFKYLYKSYNQEIKPQLPQIKFRPEHNSCRFYDLQNIQKILISKRTYNLYIIFDGIPLVLKRDMLFVRIKGIPSKII